MSKSNLNILNRSYNGIIINNNLFIRISNIDHDRNVSGLVFDLTTKELIKSIFLNINDFISYINSNNYEFV